MTLRVLVVESDPAELLYLQDVLADLDGSREWTQWTHVEALFASSWSEAQQLLSCERVDVIVLDLELCDARGKDVFRLYQATASHIPVVLIVDPDSELRLAEHLLREGAQDFLLRNQVDCAPLARAIRNAIDRHQLLASVRTTSMVDTLTGLLSRDAFLLLAERDRQIAETMHRRQLLVLAEPQASARAEQSGDEHRRDLGLVDAAEHLRNIVGPTDLVARVGSVHLAISALDNDRESAHEIFARLDESARQKCIALGAAIFDSEQALALDQLLEQAARDLHPIAATI